MKTFYVQVNFLELGSYRVKTYKGRTTSPRHREEVKEMFTKVYLDEVEDPTSKVTRLLNVSVY